MALVFGPENGAISERLVQEAAKEASLKSYTHLYVIGFAIQPNARQLIENCGAVVGIPATYTQAPPDLMMGDLLKNMRSSQIFSVCGLPEIKIHNVAPGFSPAPAGLKAGATQAASENTLTKVDKIFLIGTDLPISLKTKGRGRRTRETNLPLNQSQTGGGDQGSAPAIASVAQKQSSPVGEGPLPVGYVVSKHLPRQVFELDADDVEAPWALAWAEGRRGGAGRCVTVPTKSAGPATTEGRPGWLSTVGHGRDARATARPVSESRRHGLW